MGFLKLIKNKIFGSKTVVVFVDVQEDFMLSNGKLYVKDAESIIENLSKIREKSTSNGCRVVYTQDLHDAASKELSDNPDFINTFPHHCMMGTDGAKILNSISPVSHFITSFWWIKDNFNYTNDLGDIVITKDKFDVFSGNRNTDRIFDDLNPKRVVVCGVCTQVCVDQAVQGLVKKGYEVYVIEDAIKGLPHIAEDSFITDWKNKGVKFIKTDSLEEIL